MRSPDDPSPALCLTGERTLPGIPDEAYWFARHVVAYRLAAGIVRRRAARGAPPRVLDAGCGEGYGAQALLEAGARTVVAVDLDAATVAHVGAAYPALAPVRAELGALPCGDGVFDVVVSFQVIEHVWDPAGYLASLRRVLAPGGELLLATPNRLTFTPGSETPTNPFHVREFTAGELDEELRAAGLPARRMLGVHHGLLLRAAARVHARDLPGGEAALATRIAEEPPDAWPASLRAVVHRTRASWFRVRPDRLDASLDLLAHSVRDGGEAR